MSHKYYTAYYILIDIRFVEIESSLGCVKSILAAKAAKEYFF